MLKIRIYLSAEVASLYTQLQAGGTLEGGRLPTVDSTAEVRRRYLRSHIPIKNPRFHACVRLLFSLLRKRLVHV